MRSAPYQFGVFPGVGVSLMARILGPNGNLLTQAAVTGINAVIFEDGVQTQTAPLDKEDVVFDTLQKDGRWNVDNTGYNFRWDLPSVYIPNAEKVYSVQITIEPSGGAQPFRVAYEPHTSSWHGS